LIINTSFPHYFSVYYIENSSFFFLSGVQMMINLGSGSNFSDKVIVITGGTGVLLQPTVYRLAEMGAQIILLSRTKKPEIINELADIGKRPMFVSVDVSQKQQLIEAREKVCNAFGRVDILINGAGGNQSGATTNENVTFFDLPENAVRNVFNVNFLGAFYASQVFGKLMAEQQAGVILNISSMAGIKPLTRVVAYSAAKAALDNFTQWLAVHMAQEYHEKIRVNAITPGFLLTEQNRYLLKTPEGGLTPRGQQIVNATPMKRFGEPDEMTGTILWLISDASKFVTGIIVPVDGGFSAFGGV
jgi:NAD(P)-dependent dehydrogenase (short-subunit alcohol dehydrogenase family)